MTRKEMEFIIECLKRYQNYITDDCRMQMYDIKRDELDIREGMMQELSKIISVDKVLRLPRIEEDFRITMINKIRGNNN